MPLEPLQESPVKENTRYPDEEVAARNQAQRDHIAAEKARQALLAEADTSIEKNLFDPDGKC